MSTKKILMITINDIGSSASLGVTKKILGQYKAFQNLGCDVYNLCLDNGAGSLMHGDDKQVLFSKRIKTYFSYMKLFGMADKICKENSIDFCYIRYPLADWIFMKMVKRLHRICKVYLEIPTFPYDTEAKLNRNIVSRMNYFQDKLHRKNLHKYVDIVVTLDDYDMIYNIPCMRIENGIDIETIKFSNKYPSMENGIELISVALMRSVHGYDRIIEGLKDYYSHGIPDVIVRYNVVGDGNVVDELKLLVKEYQLEPYVIFYGKKYGCELDRIFEKCHIGFTVLAGHREGHQKTSDLKSREYCARGIPFVYAMEDDSFEACKEFRLKVPLNDDPIDISQIVLFMKEIQQKPEIHRKMHQYACENLTWESQLRYIVESACI